jgi:hypothetical protein
VQELYIEAASQIRKRFLIGDPIIEMLQVLDPDKNLLQNIRTAIVLVANTHVSQTRTAHTRTGKIDFPCGFSPNSPVKTTK